MAFAIKDYSMWRNVVSFWIKDEDTWKKINEGWLKDDNVWKKFTAVPMSIVIDSNMQNVVLYTLAGSPAAPLDLTVTINAGVVISSASPALPALDTGVFPDMSTVTIINNGTIQGAGGAGGASGAGAIYPTAGSNGGLALRVLLPTEIDNTNGVIAGGGGGGGGGGGILCKPDGVSINITVGGGGGGGGSGAAVGAGGAPRVDPLGGVYISKAGTVGAAGTATTGGAGGSGGVHEVWGEDQVIGGQGGAGGALGAGGAAGADPYFAAPTLQLLSQTSGVAGGSGGAAVQGNSFVTWVAEGTRYGGLG